MGAPAQILELIERFERNRDDYRAGRYNEAQLRREFIDPMFIALGWDVNNEAGHAEAYKDVIHEDSIRVGSATKAPDYCFRIGGTRKFFLEAKKPSVDIKGDPAPAYQLRRYAWSAKLPLSILTDFEEFAVYDCRVRPAPNDKSSTARVKYITFDQFAEQWDQIEGIFSKKAVLQGSFDRYAETSRLKKGTATVDDAFLAEIDDWREVLARNIALRNPMLDGRGLNFAVQITIDRIIFLRICEDRRLERYGQLMELFNGQDIYQRLLGLFRRADDRYNSGLFHFTREKDRPEAPDELTPALTIDDKVLKDIFKRLYYPDSPYEFSVLPAEILGQVYERFLGKVIRLTAGHRARVEEKPEVKKAGGVFYTPAYIVDYIVQNTVGKLIEGKTPRQVEAIKILDPACGSGSFLLGAYQYLLDWHLSYYLENEPEIWARKKNPPICGAVGADGYKLTAGQRKRILLNNIFGVDIDPQAVEVTKLSLLLKVLEGEKELVLVHKERALPDLAANIKCGNSLIASDFYKSKQMDLFDEEMHYKINAFDWEKEFKDIFTRKNPGFDAVIGNPPYIRIQTLKDTQPESVEYFGKNYKSAAKGNYDIYVVFVEKALGLLNTNGKMGYILPHKFFNAQYGQSLRNIIAEGKHLSHVVHFGDQQVFKGATTYTCLLILDKTAKKEIDVTKVTDLLNWQTTGKAETGKVKAATIDKSEWNFNIGSEKDLFARLKCSSNKFSDVAKVFVGTQTSSETVFVLEDCVVESDIVFGFSKASDSVVQVEYSITKPFLKGKDIRKYCALNSKTFLICPYSITSNNFTLLSEQELCEKYPLAYEYLKAHKKTLTAREKGKFNNNFWYAFGYPKSMTLFQKPKIVVPDYNKVPSFTLDLKGYFYKTGYGIQLRNANNCALLFYLGLLNSKLLFSCLLSIGTTLRGGYVRFWKQYIEQLPVVMIDFSNKTEKALHDKLVSHVETMLSLHQRLAAVRTPDERTRLERQIAATDEQIDRLVYELYGLTDEEIQIVESGLTTKGAKNTKGG